MLLWAFGCFFAIVAWLFAGVIWGAICTFVSIVWQIFVGLYQSIFVKSKLEESGFTEQKLLEERLEEAAQQQKHDDEILGQHNRIIKAAMNAVNEMRIKYPYAEEYLYDEYRNKFSAASVRQLQEIETRIRQSHFDNEMRYAVHGKDQATYTLSDLNGLEPLEEKREDPLIMRIYKINTDYLLHIKDMDSNSHNLLQSKDYFVIARVQLKIIEAQVRLKKMKQTIQSQQVNDIFEDVSFSTESFRRNRMGYLG